jgi:hypothetical protein
MPAASIVGKPSLSEPELLPLARELNRNMGRKDDCVCVRNDSADLWQAVLLWV